ncbi:hypothetical protein PsYK624_163620 [Phanerochaete sordida]|uniref:BTB domain-containing protein n=1 Tax=Phanerochaete sordida TaxID=48140 RepID=A0A9P3GQR2_9APHY|nr:hypothetical protein PsYK624_163620 [Phanerochaete sordida]
MVRRSQAQAEIGNDVARNAKRPKVEEPGSRRTSLRRAQQRALTPIPAAHPELWWSDGNVVVAAVDLSFRVHASILRRHSSIFAELLDKAPDAVGEVHEAFDECQILRVQDKGADLAEMFSVLYDGGSRGFFDWKKPIEFGKLRQITLVAIKYKVQHIIDEAAARLEHVFPTSFVPERLGVDSWVGVRPDYPVHFPHRDAAIIGAVLLARAIDKDNPPAFIATAMYHCASLVSRDLYSPCPTEDQLSLTYEDFLKCDYASGQLIRKCSWVRSPVADALQKPLCGGKACRKGLQRLVCDWIRSSAFSTSQPLSLFASTVIPTYRDAAPDAQLCKLCAVALLETIAQRQREVFADLGNIFEVPNWPAQPQA